MKIQAAVSTAHRKQRRKFIVDIKRVFLIILDSVGMGPAPDAADFGDVNPNTLGHIAASIPGFKLPVMQFLGLGNIDGMVGFEPAKYPLGSYARLHELSAGKDTTIGHWEIAGIIRPKRLPTYPNGFPEEILKPFREQTGRGVLGNCVASGTTILDELGEEHMRTGDLIVYTSADSVFQIAAHQDIVPIETLYEYCRIARKILTGEHGVARVIARPFVGTGAGHFKRTANRRDFSLVPPEETIMTRLKSQGKTVACVGKIEDIFAGEGVTFAVHNQSNLDGMHHTEECMEKFPEGLIFVNLVDFDTNYGHRRDVKGYANALTEFDNWLGNFVWKLQDGDVVMISADHGNDPTHPGTDHTREYVPLLIFGSQIPAAKNLGTIDGFCCIGQTIASMLHAGPMKNGIDLFA